jgi:hypothetical protein
LAGPPGQNSVAQARAEALSKRNRIFKPPYLGSTWAEALRKRCEIFVGMEVCSPSDWSRRSPNKYKSRDRWICFPLLLRATAIGTPSVTGSIAPMGLRPHGAFYGNDSASNGQIKCERLFAFNALSLRGPMRGARPALVRTAVGGARRSDRYKRECGTMRKGSASTALGLTLAGTTRLSPSLRECGAS